MQLTRPIVKKEKKSELNEWKKWSKICVKFSKREEEEKTNIAKQKFFNLEIYLPSVRNWSS